jgi:hypothetical protein
MIRGDSGEYDLLTKWANFDCEGNYSCEIGVREGLGSKIIMDNIKNNFIHIGVDPYGNLNYQHYDTSPSYTADYTDEMRDRLVEDMKPYQGRFHLANMTDTAFMQSSLYADKTFAFVHFDGPHMTKDVLTEAVWFANRSAPRTRFVFDDHKTYSMDTIAYALTAFNFRTIEIGEHKILLERKV